MKSIAFSAALVAAVQAGASVSQNNYYNHGGNYGAVDSAAAAYQNSAAEAGYDSDVWASQAKAVDRDSSWGKSYDSVDAKSFNDMQYARELIADDDEHANAYNGFGAQDVDQSAAAASAQSQGGFSMNGFGPASAASSAFGANSAGFNGLNWSGWGRDQDLKEKESFTLTDAKSYAAESYDEWDKSDDDKWMAQNWGVDKDAYGASSQESGAAASQYGA